MSTGRPLLELRDVTAGYGDTTVLRKVNLEVDAGTAVALLGSNGAGKTTLLRVASGVVRPSGGSVRLGDQSIAGLRPSDLVTRGLCHIPDPRGIFRSLNVRDNLTLQALDGNVGAAIDRAVQAFPRLGERLNQVAGTLSGGEQQMLAVARAYVQNPSLVLFDEVSMGLSPGLVEEIFVFIEDLKAKGTALLIVEQFVHRALALADRVYVLDRGRTVLTGSAADLDEDTIFAAYTGQHRATERKEFASHA